MKIVKEKDHQLSHFFGLQKNIKNKKYGALELESRTKREKKSQILIEDDYSLTEKSRLKELEMKYEKELLDILK